MHAYFYMISYLFCILDFVCLLHESFSLVVLIISRVCLLYEYDVLLGVIIINAQFYR